MTDWQLCDIIYKINTPALNFVWFLFDFQVKIVDKSQSN